MTRLSALLILGIAGFFLTPASASAQFGRPFGAPFGLPAGSPIIVPSTNPFFYAPRYRYTWGVQVNAPTLFGFTSVGYSRTIWGVGNPGANNYALYPSVTTYAQGGSYMTGGSSVRPDISAAQRNLALAQRGAALPGAKAEITGQWNYEKGTTPARPDAPVLPEPIRVAVAPTDPATVTSGEALNVLLKEITRLEAKKATGPSAYIPPLLLDEIQFGGSPSADLLNLARQAGSLEFPAAFDDPSLAADRREVEKDFAAVAVAVQAGKSPDPLKLIKLESRFQQLEKGVTPLIKNLPFEDATAARRFLNRMTAAIKAMKSGTANGLIDPKWAAEGLTVADLTKHMTKHKLQFGPATNGSDEAYATLHQNLATYLFVLNQPKK